MKPGVLLVNVGTPDAPRTPEVRRYLREFLGDPYVIDINAVSRWLLLNLIILPRRPAKSAEAYRKVWTDAGSPLLVHSQDLVAKLREKLGPELEVELGMRYGNPSLESALKRLLARGIDRLTVLPLYPQNALSSTGTSVDKVKALVARERPDLPVTYLGAFYDRPGFLDAFVQVGRPVLEHAHADHVLFSFHGLPARQVKKTDRSGGRHCLQSETCCDRIVDANRDCYRAQSFFTARALAERLGLPKDGFTVSFQSRLGSGWITPFTDVVVPELAAKGVKRLVVFCPAFVADCLETLEEIGIRLREQFKGCGGDELFLVPSLNATSPWVEEVAQLVTTGGSA